MACGRGGYLTDSHEQGRAAENGKHCRVFTHFLFTALLIICFPQERGGLYMPSLTFVYASS